MPCPIWSTRCFGTADTLSMRKKPKAPKIRVGKSKLDSSKKPTNPGKLSYTDSKEDQIDIPRRKLRISSAENEIGIPLKEQANNTDLEKK